jgi:hypothetical protein
MQHLNEDMLIKYLFGLADAGSEHIIAAHLSDCDTCSSNLEQVKRRFAALDLLAGEITASDETIALAIDNAKKPPVTGFKPFAVPLWLTAAAAVIVVASLLFITSTNNKKTPAGGVAKNQFAPGEAFSPEGITVGGLMSAVSPSAEKTAIDDKPPFAPASAIELVVLPRRDNVQLTIYNSADLTLVRERRNLTMKRGWNWLQFMWANTLIDPTSLTLEPLARKEKIDVQQLVYPARLKDIGRWLIRSEVDGQVPFEITYFTSGLTWRAFYMGTLSADDRTMHLAGFVRVDNNSGEDYEDAQTRLIVGQVHILDQIAQLAGRQYPYDRPGMEIFTRRAFDTVDRSEPLLEKGLRSNEWFDAAVSDKKKDIAKEGLSEYFLYTIEGTETIPNTWAKRLPSFEADDIGVESLYKYDETRWGGETIRFISFANDIDHKLGVTPIPDGSVKIYGRADSDGYLSYVGGTSFKYIPVNEEVELDLGAARGVKVEPVLMDSATANYEFDKDNNISGWDEISKWKLDVRNSRDIPVKVEITRTFDTTYWTLVTDENGYTYKKYDATSGRFELELAPQTKKTIEYTLTTYRGTRQEKVSL